MSALPPEADMLIVGINVCYVPIADIRIRRGAAGKRAIRFASRARASAVATTTRLAQQVFDLDREFPHTNPRRVVHRRRNGGREAGEADLADAACSSSLISLSG